MQFYPIQKDKASVQVQAIKWEVLQQICEILMNKPAFRDE